MKLPKEKLKNRNNIQGELEYVCMCVCVLSSHFHGLLNSPDKHTREKIIKVQRQFLDTTKRKSLPSF